MKQIDPSLKYASVVLAGGAYLVLALGRFFSPFSGLVPIRGIWMVTQLSVPLLCLWCGMLVHYRIGRPKPWLSALVGIFTAGALWGLLSYPSIRLSLYNLLLLVFNLLLGFLLPWDHLRENGDKSGTKSALLCILSALIYAALFLVWHRLGDDVMKPENADMEALLETVTTTVLPFAGVLPLFFATEFAFSKAGQWLGSRKWFFWLTVPFAVYCFFGSLTRIDFHYWFTFPYDATNWIRVLVQPMTVYLLVVIWRIIRNRATSRIEWKEVFKI